MDGAGADPTPIYLRIAQDIEGRIQSGALGVGERVPSERTLAGELGTSRMTARQALQHLVGKGLLETRSGLGTFVGARRLETQLSTLVGFSEEMARSGHVASSLILFAETVLADEDCAAALGLGPRARVHRLVRVRLADALPVAVETTEVPATLAPGLLERADFSRESLYAVLRRDYGRIPAEAEQTMTAGHPDAMAARALGIPADAPVLKLTRCTFDAQRTPIEFVRSTYRGDSFQLRAHLTIAGAR
ncbi:MAG: GntR family transcriptional regulator [Alphaproteobacteria bacterium]